MKLRTKEQGGGVEKAQICMTSFMRDPLPRISVGTNLSSGKTSSKRSAASSKKLACWTNKNVLIVYTNRLTEAQMAASSLHDRKVVGSNPVISKLKQ